MDDEIELISDGDGLAVIGAPEAVERFLAAENMPSRPLPLEKLDTFLRAGAGAADAGSVLAANAGRWVKLTKESAQQIDKYKLMKGASPGLKRGIVQAKGGKIKHIVQFTKGPGSVLTNPAVLAGAGGIMAQLAMQQSMDEITDYLAKIDKKLDAVLRAQKDSILADMIGVDFVIDEAMTIRKTVGRVSDVTWSKVQGTSMTIARTQGYALRQLDAIAAKLERETNMGALADLSKEAKGTVQEWLAVLARCFQLQDAIAVLEIDRVLDSSPSELDQHRLALQTARHNRRDLISRSTSILIARMDAAAETANAKVLLNPFDAKAVVTSTNEVAGQITEFHIGLGVDGDRSALAAKRWTEAVADTRDDLFEAGLGGVDAAKRMGSATFVRARSASDKLAIRLAERALRRRDGETDDEPRQLPDGRG